MERVEKEEGVVVPRRRPRAASRICIFVSVPFAFVPQQSPSVTWNRENGKGTNWQGPSIVPGTEESISERCN